jgi:hypothetical protein
LSQRAMALAMRDRLRDVMNLDAAECGVRPPPGKPPASCGEKFIAIWENGISNDATESRDDRHALAITVTRRVTYAPGDREAEEVIDEAVVGLEVFADQIASLVHGDFGNTTGSTDTNNNYAIMNAANDYIAGVLPAALVNTSYGFTEPLRFLSATRTEEKNGDWFGGDPAERDVGRAITLYFGKARRVANLLLQR